MKYAISSCLMGICCKYNGSHNQHDKLIEYMLDCEYILVCPEVLGGLRIPRPCVEFVNAKAITNTGNDVTDQFYRGANRAMELLKEAKIDVMITQPRSPSCGKGMIYDGTFQKRLISGDGIFVKMLIENGFQVMNVDDFIKKIEK